MADKASARQAKALGKRESDETSRSSSVVERFLGKEEVTSPTLVCGSLNVQKHRGKKHEDESLAHALI